MKTAADLRFVPRPKRAAFLAANRQPPVPLRSRVFKALARAQASNREEDWKSYVELKRQLPYEIRYRY